MSDGHRTQRDAGHGQTPYCRYERLCITLYRDATYNAPVVNPNLSRGRPMSGEILEQEIREQPEVIQRLVEGERRNVEHIATVLRGHFDYAIIAARGTSDNAARYAQYLLGAYNRVPIALATPSLFTLYRQPPALSGALVIGISQSGQSPDIVSVLEEGRRQRRPTLAITNDAGSPLAQTADHVIALSCGPERAVAATKTYTASLAAIALLSGFLAEDRHALEQLQRVPDLMQRMLSRVTDLAPYMERYRFMDHCAIIGRGFNYATAFEIALKIKELTRIMADPYSSADFLHGPIAMVQNGFPVLAIAPFGHVLEDMRALIEHLTELRAELIVVSDVTDLLEVAHLPMTLPDGLPERLSPLVAVLPGQYFGLTLARMRGMDPDQPAGLTKVTETW